jgi:hypothetical protein
MYLAAKCIKPPSSSAIAHTRNNTTTNKSHLGPMWKNLDKRIPTNMFHTKFVDTLQFLRTLIFKYVYQPQTLTSMNATQNCIWQSVIKESNDKYVFAIMCNTYLPFLHTTVILISKCQVGVGSPWLIKQPTNSMNEHFLRSYSIY